MMPILLIFIAYSIYAKLCRFWFAVLNDMMSPNSYSTIAIAMLCGSISELPSSKWANCQFFFNYPWMMYVYEVKRRILINNAYGRNILNYSFLLLFVIISCRRLKTLWRNLRKFSICIYFPLKYIKVEAQTVALPFQFFKSLNFCHIRNFF